MAGPTSYPWTKLKLLHFVLFQNRGLGWQLKFSPEIYVRIMDNGCPHLGSDYTLHKRLVCPLCPSTHDIWNIISCGDRWSHNTLRLCSQLKVWCYKCCKGTWSTVKYCMTTNDLDCLRLKLRALHEFCHYVSVHNSEKGFIYQVQNVQHTCLRTQQR